MTRTSRLLRLAIAGSLLLHLLPFLPEFISSPEKASTAKPMTASLRPPPALPASTAPPPEIPLSLPKESKAKAPEKTQKQEKKLPEKTAPTAPKTWTQAVRQHLKKLQDEGQFYPEEARRNGIQGEALVYLMIDPSGKVIAARIEESSGHRILDEAALRAVRSLSSLPADAPQETLLPVRFRLR